MLDSYTETVDNLIKIGKLQENPAYARRWAQKYRTVENDNLATLVSVQHSIQLTEFL